LFSGLQQVENQLIESILEYCAKSGATVDFSEIYSKPFGKPCKHWKFLTKKLAQIDVKTKSHLWKSNQQMAEQRNSHKLSQLFQKVQEIA